MIIECVVTASRYADFLKVTIPYTLRQVDHLVVVTSDSDYDDPTRDLCKFYCVKCVSTDAFHRHGAKFSKGVAINKGLEQLGRTDWILHLDADIVLPDHTRSQLNKLNDADCLDPACIYGIDRVNCPNWAAWEAYESRSKHQPQYQYNCLINFPGNFTTMGRYVHPDDNYVPIGFFQLWHTSAYRFSFDKRYPTRGNEAVHTDVQHAIQWDGKNRRLIPEIVGIHLDSCSAPIGANWRGRVTPEFGPQNPNPSNAGVKSYYSPQGGKPVDQNPNFGVSGYNA